MNGRLFTPDELSLNERLADVGDPAHILVYTLLKVHADDQGRLDSTHRRTLKARIAPLYDFLAVSVINEAVAVLEGVGLVLVYEVGGGEYLQLLDWTNTRRWRYPSAFPPPEGWTDDVNCRRGDPTTAGDPDDEDPVEPSPTAAVGRCPPPSDNGGQRPQGEGEGVGVGCGDGEGDGEGERPRKRRKRAPPASPDPPATPQQRPLAVDVYRSEAHLWPESALWPDLAQVDDLEHWRRVVHAWIAAGWSKRNVAGMLECYARGEIPGTKKPARGSGRRQPDDIMDPRDDKYTTGKYAHLFRQGRDQ